MNYRDRVETKQGLESMLGRMFVSVEATVGGDEMVFVSDDGDRFIFAHDQDCCERVDINDIVGDVRDLVGEPLLVAEEVSVSNPGGPDLEDAESYTWTFYKFATRRGYVDVRWLGHSNGYYSEAVDLFHIKAGS